MTSATSSQTTLDSSNESKFGEINNANPLSWLKEYVDLNLPTKQLAERLTLAGLEVEGIRKLRRLVGP